MKKVVVLGGGVAGLSAAHELIERGFAVEVYEAMKIPGGKARSIDVRTPLNSQVYRATIQGKPLPGEHGFRFFPRFYKHVTNTMSRIPYGKDGWVIDNLVPTTRVEIARYDNTPIVFPTRFIRSINDLQVVLGDTCVLLSEEFGIPREEMAFFGTRLWQILTSCPERRLNEYEKISWWNFIHADEFSEAYRRFMAYGATRSLVAAKAHLASAKTIGDMYVQILMDIATPGPSTDRLLNGPTNHVWIDPWLEYLTQRGVQYHRGARVTEIHCVNGKIQGATIDKDNSTFTVQGDYYIAAIPVERMADLLTPALIAADPTLAHLVPLAKNGVDWMIGIQFYLTKDVRINNGHTLYLNSEWALTSVSQRQFWTEVDFSQYADGSIQGILSVDISEWDAVGLCGKTAKQCTELEIKNEVWEQLKRSLNVNGQTILKDEYLHDFYMPPDLYKDAAGMERNEEPLLVNLLDTWRLRPEATTRIPNLFLASDYVRTYTDLATMEGANEAARRAVNGILEASKVDAPACGIWNLHEPDLLEPLRALDRLRYYQGLPWDDSLAQIALSATNIASASLRMIEQAIGIQAGTVLSQLAQPTTPLGDATTEGTLSNPFGSEQITTELLTRIGQMATMVTKVPTGIVDQASDITVHPSQHAVTSDSVPIERGRVRIIPQQ